MNTEVLQAANKQDTIFAIGETPYYGGSCSGSNSIFWKQSNPGYSICLNRNQNIGSQTHFLIGDSIQTHFDDALIFSFAKAIFKLQKDGKKGINNPKSAVIENRFQGMESDSFTSSYKFIENKFDDELTNTQSGILISKIAKEFIKTNFADPKTILKAFSYALEVSKIPFKNVSFEHSDNFIQFNILLKNKGSDEFLFLITVPNVVSIHSDVIYSFFINRELEVSNARPLNEVIKGIKELLASE